MFLSKQVGMFAKMCSKLFFFMNEWTNKRNDRMKILCIKLCMFMYIIMKVYVKVYNCLSVNITVLKFSNIFVWV